MIIITMKYRMIATVLTALLWSMHSLADAPQLTLQMRTGQMAGTLRDGTLLAQGAVTFSGEHTGFRVYSLAALNGTPARYTLTARDNPTARLHVRLIGTDWQPDMVTGQGIIRRTSDYSANFRVEVDGTQLLPVASWPLQLQAVVLLP